MHVASLELEKRMPALTAILLWTVIITPCSRGSLNHATIKTRCIDLSSYAQFPMNLNVLKQGPCRYI